MAYKGWKMMDKIDVAVKTAPDDSYRGRTFNGYVVEHGDKKALESAKDWAREREYDYEKRKYTGNVHEPKIHTFDNEGFTVKILESAGGSSQGGRLSFLACEIEKDGIKFVIGVNDELLVDLIRNSEISKGVIKEKVMFVRKAGRPGFIHEGMEAYKEAQADMKHKADMKSAKKTNKWEIGGVYSSITQTDICIGEVFDTIEEVTETDNSRLYHRYNTQYVKREKPVKMLAWMRIYGDMPTSFTDMLQKELDSGHIWFSAGKPPARAKTGQLEVKESDLKLIDKMLAKRKDGDWNARFTGRYVRSLK